MLKNNAKIMIVEDMTTMRAIIKQTVESLGYKNIEMAKDGDSAWQSLEKSSVVTSDVGLILSDWNMPGSLDGLGLLVKIRQASHLKHIPFVMLTAKAEQCDIDAAKKAGANGFLSKPFTPQDLKNALMAVIKGA